MPSTGLTGPFKLDVETITRTVASDKIGAYVLGRDAGTFYVSYVGRADNDLAGRLKKHAADGRYPAFEFAYLPTQQEAFEKECHLYHDFDPPKNVTHPAPPGGGRLKCPRCRQLG